MESPAQPRRFAWRSGRYHFHIESGTPSTWDGAAGRREQAMDTNNSQTLGEHGQAASKSEIQSGRESAPGSPRKGLIEAARFWEPRRLLYNLLLTTVVLIWVVKTWPHFRPAMTLESLGIMAVLALLANLCYCAGYLTEILIQNSTSSWYRQRWAVWVVGTLLAILFENYWIADEIYPFVR